MCRYVCLSWKRSRWLLREHNRVCIPPLSLTDIGHNDVDVIRLSRIGPALSYFTVDSSYARALSFRQHRPKWEIPHPDLIHPLSLRCNTCSAVTYALDIRSVSSKTPQLVGAPLMGGKSVESRVQHEKSGRRCSVSNSCQVLGITSSWFTSRWHAFGSFFARAVATRLYLTVPFRRPLWRGRQARHLPGKSYLGAPKRRLPRAEKKERHKAHFPFLD